MSEVNNVIWTGHTFEQQFSLDAGVIPDGAGLRATVNYAKLSGGGPAKMEIAFEHTSTLLWSIKLTKEQTKLMSAGVATVDPVITATAGSPEAMLGVRITIPVLLPATPPSG